MKPILAVLVPVLNLVGYSMLTYLLLRGLFRRTTAQRLRDRLLAWGRLFRSPRAVSRLSLFLAAAVSVMVSLLGLE